MLRRLLDGWREIARYIGDFQARLLLTIFYFTVALPFGLIMRLKGDPLRLRRPPAQSAWAKRDPQQADISSAHRQF